MAEHFIDLNSTSQDRYSLSKFMKFTDIDDPLTSNFLDELLKIRPTGTYVVKNELARPDMLSYRIYGSTQYWWVILYYNSMTSVYDITLGMTISYPSITDLEELYFSLAPKEKLNV